MITSALALLAGSAPIIYRIAGVYVFKRVATWILEKVFIKPPSKNPDENPVVPEDDSPKSDKPK